MIKQLVLPLVGVIAFIIAVGVFTQRSGSLSFSNLPATASSTPILKSISVGGKSLSVEVANTKDLRAKGLSGRTLLGADNGMLFTFDQPNVTPGFWMKGMLIPLDIIWINDGVIIGIDKNIPAPAPGTPDSSLRVYYPFSPIDQVLEVNSGYSDSHGLKINSQVILPAL